MSGRIQKTISKRNLAASDFDMSKRMQATARSYTLVISGGGSCIS
jgi:UDP-N-acetylglucosamine transferase subunit ALG13